MLINKGAMFGLEGRVLKKQSGRLFLTSLRKLTFRLVEGQQATRVSTAKGAMFGLDARIALAIFGSLSVISGAALYSAIKEAKVTAILTEMQEVAKAYEQFYLDTSTHVKQASGGQDTVNIEELVDNTESRYRWKGPYLSYAVSGLRNGLVTEYDDIILRIRNTTDWGKTSGIASVHCTTKNDCLVWIGWLFVPTEIAKALDLKIDGIVDDSKGRLRFGDWSTESYVYYNTGISYKEYQ
ncbi:MAG TPA: hypothetical protein DCL21_05315 [Alphaproteobacteria bacterium]|nr:hypothetical protein [Alphaproteobacteria bacterium]